MSGTSYFQAKPKPMGKDVSDLGLRMKEGQVTKIHFIDEETNKSKKYVEYDVLARDSKGGLVTYQNCRFIQDMSGYNDFSETVLEPNEAALQGKLDSSNFAANMNGTMVVLAFLDGSFAKPIIIGGFPHRRNSGAKKSDGIRKKKSFRGLTWEINKDGELIVTQKGSSTPDGKQKDKTLNTQVKFDKTGKLIATVGNNGLKAEWDGKNDKITYTTAGGPKITIDGAGTITISANGTLIIIDGNSGKISLTGNLVDVGAGASALAALGPQLVSWLTSHTHMYSPGPGTPVPSQPPTVPPPTSVLSTTVKIKA